MATLINHTKSADAAIRLAAAKRLIQAAIALQTYTMDKLNIANPPPHRTPAPVGDYPKKRTGNLQKGILYEPTTPAAVARDLIVRVGYAAQAFYGIALANRGWKSVLDAANEKRAELKEIIEG